MPPKFQLGRLAITATANSFVNRGAILAALQRHRSCDWGEVPASDRKSNDSAVILGERLISAYTDSAGTKFWIITEADRSATTILLPEDY